jgi:hypothetical protein
MITFNRRCAIERNIILISMSRQRVGVGVSIDIAPSCFRCIVIAMMAGDAEYRV